MQAIYEPAGKAAEYSPLACNLFSGCSHRCKYCYCPGIRRQSLDQWAANPQPRAGILAALRKDAAKLRGDPRPILFCFMSDPYQRPEAAALTQAALRICAEHDLTAQVLTKNPMAAMREDGMDRLLRRPGWMLGSTICFRSEDLAEHWEPGAPAIASRIAGIRVAHALGVSTWVSVEPVVDPAEALRVIRDLTDVVDYWKIGKLNHFQALERAIDWSAFRTDVEDLLLSVAPGRYYLKRDLAAYPRLVHDANKILTEDLHKPS